MGSSVSAKCPCGLDVEIAVGGGMRDFETTCYFPCLCDACHNIVPVNLLAKAPQCPRCKGKALIPYDDPRMSTSSGTSKVMGWNMKEKLGREVSLTDANYFCPKCNNMSLLFRDTSLRWD